MSQVGATLPPPPPTTSSAGTEGTGRQVPIVSAYEGKCEGKKQHVYDVVPGKNGFDVFAKTTTEIGFIAQTVLNGGELHW
jgi:hypothetical protein